MHVSRKLSILIGLGLPGLSRAHALGDPDTGIAHLLLDHGVTPALALGAAWLTYRVLRGVHDKRHPHHQRRARHRDREST